MNAALLFYGEPGYIDNNDIYQSFDEKIIKKYKPDIFCHVLFSYKNNKFPYNSIDLINKNFKPKHLEIFNPSDIILPQYSFKKISPNDFKNYLHNMYSIQCVSRMLKKWMEFYNKNYDIIILSKYNLIINNFTDLSQLDTSKSYSLNNKLDETFMIFNKKYLDWSSNIYDDIFKYYTDNYLDIYKFNLFLKRFNSQDINQLNINIKQTYFKNIKIALLLYGQPRFIQNFKVYDKFKEEIIDKYDTDVYCHCWFSNNKDTSFDTSTWSGFNNNKCNISDEAIDMIKKFYNPIDFEQDEPRYFSFTKEQVDNLIRKDKEMLPININNLLSHFYSIQKVARIFERNINKCNYDLIIVSRYDIFITEIPQDMSLFNPDKLYLSNLHDRFPDTVYIHGKKFLQWQTNIYDDIFKVLDNPSGTCPESYKKDTFMLRYSMSDVIPQKLNTLHIRQL